MAMTSLKVPRNATANLCLSLVTAGSLMAQAHPNEPEGGGVPKEADRGGPNEPERGGPPDGHGACTNEPERAAISEQSSARGGVHDLAVPHGDLVLLGGRAYEIEDRLEPRVEVGAPGLEGSRLGLLDLCR